MRKYSAIKIMALLVATMPVLFSACMKDSCKKQQVITMFLPVYGSKAEVRDNIKSNAPKPLKKPGKIYIRGNTIFLNEIDKGIHVIDNSNPSNPVNVAFIDIPGNLDIAVKGNTLYADMYTDLVTLDITNPSNVIVKKFSDNIFPYRNYGNGFVANTDQIIIDWVRKDTTITTSCDMGGPIMVREDAFTLASAGTSQSNASTSAPTGAGVGGSMARFTIVNDRLYTVSMSHLDVFNISNPADPQRGNPVPIGWNIETIYPFKDKLFIGSRTGMFVYSLANIDAPAYVSQFQHADICDPVIADDNYAYVTLHAGTTCMGTLNQLDIVKLNNLSNPVLQKTYQMTSPHGLSKDGDLLFICDGQAGLKLYNASDVMNLQLLKVVTTKMAYDVITFNKIALLIGDDGLYQYDYSNPSMIRLLSKINISLLP
jgi:hypothetical protein